MSSHEPLQITANMRTRVIADEWLPFDAFLYFQIHREHFGAQEMTTPGAYAVPNDPKLALPLSIAHEGQATWFYHSSWAEWGPHKDYQDHWNKRFDFGLGTSLVDFNGKRGSVQVQRGEFKAYHMPVFCRFALWIRWYCVGDRGEIIRLLSTMTNIGKKYAQGEGRVYRWDVEPAENDYSVWKDGKLMRGIPVQDAKASGNIVYYGIRPSYWHAKNQMPLVVP